MIREALPSDIDRILELGQECHKKAATAEVPVNVVQARRIIAQFVVSPAKAAFVSEVDGRVLGILLGGIAPIWFSDEKEASDLLFYVSDDAQGRAVGSGTLLLKRFIAWGWGHGAARIAMAVSFGGPMTKSTAKIYTKQGLMNVGNIFYLSRRSL